MKPYAIFSPYSDDIEKLYRQCKGNFRQPLPRFTPGQMSSEVALAACGTLYLCDVTEFSRNALKHAAYLTARMVRAARPRIVLVHMHPLTVTQSDFLNAIFKPLAKTSATP